MLSFVLITSILNLLIGACLALLVTARAHPRIEKAAESAPPAPPAKVAKVEKVEKVESPQPIKFVMEDLSPAWIEKLAADSVVAKSLVEASSLVLRLEVGRYRENLVKWEDEIRAIPDREFGAKIREPIAEIVKLNEAWLKIQSEALKLLSGKSGKLDNFRAISQQLEEMLLNQTSQIESTANDLLQLRTTEPPEKQRVIVSRELQRLIELAHLLRDLIHRTLLAIFVADKRVERAEKKLITDAQTQLLSPIGLEGAFELWKQGDLMRNKPASVGLLSLDQFKNLNASLGTRWVDGLIASAAQLCGETIRKDRGFDRISRLNGDTFAIFYGDTSIRSCVIAMERLRQTLQQTTFTLNGKPLALKATCALATQARSESTSITLDRASAALKVAKAKARKQIVIDEGNGPEIVDSPPITVRAGRIEVPTTLEKSEA